MHAVAGVVRVGALTATTGAYGRAKIHVLARNGDPALDGALQQCEASKFF
jgi:hypothetical protein